MNTQRYAPEQAYKKLKLGLSSIFAMIGFIASIITITTIFTTPLIPLIATWFTHQLGWLIPAAIFVLGIIVTLVSLLLYLFVSRGIVKVNTSEKISWLSNRVQYLDVVIEWVGKSERSVLLCVDTLDASRKDKKISILQEKLQDAKIKGKDVRIISPNGVERTEAAYELARLKGIPIKFLSYLADGDFRFTLVDDNVIIVSIGKHGKPSSECAVIISERLKIILQRYSDELWARLEAMDYNQFIADEIRKLRDPSNPITNKGLAERLGIPLSEVERILSGVIDKN